MKRKYGLTLIICIIVLMAGCKNVSDPVNSHYDNIIYYNSFETAEDTAGFSGYGYYVFRDESSPDGGNYSLYVTGACAWPHVKVEIPAQSTNGYYQLKGWGRNLGVGGSVELYNNWPGHENSIYIGIIDSVWTHYTANSILYCPEGHSMILIMGAGGFIPSAMLVDQIKIIKIK